MWASSTCGKWGLLSSCGAQVSHCSGCFCCGHGHTIVLLKQATWWWLWKLPLPSTNSNLTRDLNSELLVPHEHILPCQTKVIAVIHVIMWQVLHQALQFYLNRSFHCQLLNHFMKSASLSQFLLLQMQKRRLRGWIISPIIQLIDEHDIFIQDCFRKVCSFDAEGLQTVFFLVWCFLWHLSGRL